MEIPFALVWTLRDGVAVRVDQYTDTALLLQALEAVSPAGPSAF